MDGQMKVTVGICAYNTEKYIKQCLLSVLGQSYENLEIIAIDDGSTDSTGAFLDTVTDTRVRVIHKQNEGLSAGREQVVQLMTGDALYWLDSDDYLMPEAISDSVSLMQQYDADIVKTVFFKWEYSLCGIYTGDEYMRVLLRTSKGHNVIGCLFRKELYEGVHHKIELTCEDFHIFPRLVERSSRIVLENNGTYRYRLLRPGSITAMGRNSFLGFYPLSIHLYDRYERYKNAYPEECKNVLNELTYFTCMACLFAGDDPRAVECRDILTRVEPEIMASDSVGRYYKWLTKKILSSWRFLPAVKAIHNAKQRLRTFAGDIVKGRKLSYLLERFKLSGKNRAR